MRLPEGRGDRVRVVVVDWKPMAASAFFALSAMPEFFTAAFAVISAGDRVLHGSLLQE